MYFKDLDALRTYYEKDDFSNKREWLVFLADRSDYFLMDLTKFCSANNIELIGGIYSGLLVKDEYMNEGLIVLEIHSLFKTKVLPHMMRSCTQEDLIINNTAIVLADGLSPQFKVLIDTVFNRLEDKVTYVGGGAGYYDMIQRPCIFDNKGLYKDVAIVAVLDHPSVVHYRHGWERLEGPFLASKSIDNILCEIDGSPAFDVYNDILKDHIHEDITIEDFFKTAKNHPFGIDLGQEVDIVRDPISVNEKGEIICVAGIPEESDIYILEGNLNTLLKSSFEVAKVCRKNPFIDSWVLLFDCISRAICLGDSFKKELGNIQVIIEKPVYGALSIGEISSLNNGKIQIHNKSAVLAAIEK